MITPAMKAIGFGFELEIIGLDIMNTPQKNNEAASAKLNIINLSFSCTDLLDIASFRPSFRYLSFDLFDSLVKESEAQYRASLASSRYCRIQGSLL